jgi:hypothetical protein
MASLIASVLCNAPDDSIATGIGSGAGSDYPANVVLASPNNAENQFFTITVEEGKP